MNSSFRISSEAGLLPVRIACLLLLTGVAHAQLSEDDMEKQPDEGVEAIIVTGSRLGRSGYDTPTPVTVLGTEAIERQAPVNIADLVNELPAIAGSESSTTSLPSMASGNAGIAALSLRALGPGRTLVLLDGHRSSVSTSAGWTDINTMPQGLIERVETVTGGASAAYGSGAIGGVVNFILDHDFTGIKSTMQYGVTTYGDNENSKFSLAAGTPFADGDGHLLFSGEIADIAGIHANPNALNEVYRDWNTHGHFAMPNPDPSPGEPAYIIDNHIGITHHTPGGIIVSGPLRGTYFGVNGTINQFAYGDTGGIWTRGGDWTVSSQAGNMSLQAAEERRTVYVRGSYELTPNFDIFGTASYATFDGHANYIQVETLRIPIQRDNAFLPTEIAAAMDETGIDSFLMSSTNADAPVSGNQFSRDTQRYVVGANGLFTAFDAGVDWDFYYQKSITYADQQYKPTIYHLERMAMATDAVFDPVSGRIVCRSTLSNPDNGCIPLNRFGIGVDERGAWDYVMGAPYRNETYTLDVAAVNFRPDDLPGWAGPIGIAFGAEWRRQEISGEVPEQYSSGWRYSNFKEDEGHFDVIEGYVEALVPIGYGLDFNGAFRLSDYSTSGLVRSWKAGFNFSPAVDDDMAVVGDLTLRATMSRDIRSPNLGELFRTGTTRGNTVSIEGVTVAFQQSLQGSTELDAETADSWNVGLVFEPSSLPGFGASVDYYDIEVNGVIDSVTIEQTVNFCFEAQIQEYCDNIHFAVPGNPLTLTFIDLYYENLNSLRARGLDVEASYEIGLAELFDGGAGHLSFRALGTHYIDNVTDNGVTAIDIAGANEDGSTPSWKYRLSASYALEPWMINLTARGVTEGVIRESFIECSSNCPPSSFPHYTVNDNSIDGQIVFDAYFSRSVDISDVDLEFFGLVKNLFNTDPPLTANPLDEGRASEPSFPQTNLSIFDYLGRRFVLGVRGRWGGS